MTGLVFERVSDEWLGSLTFRVDSGLTIITGEAAPIGRILAIAAGARVPRRGRVTLDGANVAAPGARRRIAALLPEEELIAATSVLESVAAAIALRGIDAEPRSVLEDAGLGDLAARKTSRLGAAEHRAVALALALADSTALALLVHDPLSSGGSMGRPRVVEVCLERARSVPVLVTTPHLEDALSFGGELLTFARGTVHALPSQRSTNGVAVAVHSKQARRLAGLLAGESGIVGVVFDAERAPFEVLVKAVDPEALADTITRIVCDNAVPVSSLVTRPATADRAMPGIWVGKERAPAGSHS